MRLELFDSHSLQGEKPVLELSVSSVDDLPYRWHEDLGMLMVLKGNILFHASTLKKRLGAGDVELVSVDEIHRIKGDEGNIILFLKIETALAESFIPEIRDVVFDCNLYPGREVSKQVQQRFCAIFSSFFLHVYGKKDQTLDEVTLAKLAEILNFIMEQFDIVSKVLNGKELGAAERSNLQSRYRRVADFIFKNSSRRIGLRDIAERENLSLSFLSHAIKDLFGNGFQELINYQRVCSAMKLLLSTDFNITDIAFECGFSAPRYLMNRFEEFLDMKPAEFRKRYQGDGKIPETLIHDVDTLSSLELLKLYSAEHRAVAAGVRRVPVDLLSEPLSFIDWTVLEPEKVTASKLSLSEDDWTAALGVLKGIMDRALRDGLKGAAEDLQCGALTREGFRTSLFFVLSSLSLLGKNLVYSAPGVLVCRGKPPKGRRFHILLLNDSVPDNPAAGQDQSILLDFQNFSSCRMVRKRFTEENSSPGCLWRFMGSPEEPDGELPALMDDFLAPEISHMVIPRPDELNIILPSRSFELISILPVV